MLCSASAWPLCDIFIRLPPPAPRSGRLEFGDFSFDLNTRVLVTAGQIVPLPPKTSEILALLIENAGSLVTREMMVEEVWKGGIVEEGNITQRISDLRRALDRLGGTKVIKTVHRRGYVFAAELSPSNPAKLLPTQPPLRRPSPVRPTSVAGALRHAAELTRLLARLHGQGSYQRDFSPAGLLGEAEGTLSLADPEQEMPPRYRAPEVLSGAPPEGTSDIFSLGVVLAEMICGSHPFGRETEVDTRDAILNGQPRLFQADGDPLGPGLQLCLRRLLAKSATDRYQSLPALREDLQLLSMSLFEKSQAPNSSSQSLRRTPLFGRESEQAMLRSRLVDALDGNGSVILVGADAGMGKTRLGEFLTAEAIRQGLFAGTGHCRALEGLLPFAPFVEILEQSLQIAPPVSFLQALGDSASEIAGIFPDLRDKYPTIAPRVAVPADQQRRRLIAAWCRFVTRACRVSPMAAIIEDLHWADDSSLQLLVSLAEIAETLPLVIYATYRANEAEGNKPLLAALGSMTRTHALNLTLRPLSAEAVNEMSRAIAGTQPAAAVSKHIGELSEGNPLFVGELVKQLTDEGRFDVSQSGATQLELPTSVPQTLSHVLARRLERLTPGSRQLLANASLVGRTFPFNILVALNRSGVVGAEDASAIDALEEAQRAQLLAPVIVGRDIVYRFDHELIRQALIETVSFPRRQQVHVRIADALESMNAQSQDEQAYQIAYHLFHAGPCADSERTIRALIKAAAHATWASAHEDAWLHYTRALAIRESSGDRPEASSVVDILAQRAAVLRNMSRGDESVADYERAISLCEDARDWQRAASLTVALAWVFFWKADGRSGLMRLAHAFSTPLVPGSDPHCRLKFLEAVMLSRAGRGAEAVAALDTAIAAQRLLDAPDLAALAGHIECRVCISTGDFPRAVHGSQIAVPVFSAVGDVWNNVDARTGPAFHDMFCGFPARGEELSLAILKDALAIGNQFTIWQCRNLISMSRFAAGDLDGVIAILEDPAATARQGSLGRLLPSNARDHGGIAFLRGDLAAARGFYSSVPENEEESFLAGIPTACWFLFLAEAGDGEAESVMPRVRRWLPTPGSPNSLGRWGALMLYLFGLASLKRYDEAAALWPVAEDMVKTGMWGFSGTRSVTAAAAIAAGAAGRLARAEELFRLSIHQADTAPYRIMQGFNRERYAEFLVDHGKSADRARARILLAEARAVWHGLGLNHASRYGMTYSMAAA